MILPIHVCYKAGLYQQKCVLYLTVDFFPKATMEFSKVTAKFAILTIKVIETIFYSCCKCSYFLDLRMKQHFPLRYVIDMESCCQK